MNVLDKFDPEKCTLCGECLIQCPVMALPREKAVLEIKKLVAGDMDGKVLSKCESCFTCNYICPEKANPACLILDRWHDMYKEKGLLARADYFIPHSVPNFRTFVIDRLPPDEKSMVESWQDESPCEQIFFPGCNWITAPYLAKSPLLKDMNIRGSLEMCCGEMYFRMGQYEQLEKTADRLSGWLARMGVKKMMIPCTAGKNIFTNVLPRYGFDYDVEITHMLDWLLEKLKNNEIKIERKLDIKVTIQESCHAKAFGEEFINTPREILEMTGVQVVEEKLHGDKMTCCGIGGGFSFPSSYNPLRLTTSTLRNLKLAKNTGADAIVTYCAGCSQMLATGQISNPLNRMPIFHILEIVDWARGIEPISRSEKMKRAAFFLLGVTRHQAPALLSGKRSMLE